MTALQSLSGNWKGEYICGPEYEIHTGRTVQFTLELIENNGSISGTCIDFETKEHFSEPITVSGFIDKGFISLVKQYPFFYFIDELGQVVVDRTKPHPEITLSGEFNPETNSFEGEWDLVADSQKFGDGYFDDSLTGTWTIKKIDN
ncbi:MAG: hypothetical protein M3R27_13070 [Bacteroidota bacterium]|nr:hypothetical protein [Bacteroidota bacterium]